MNGTYQNFISGSAFTDVNGTNCMKLWLVSSKSVVTQTSSWSAIHSATITYNTTSLSYYSESFNASQYKIGINAQAGMYYSTFTLTSSVPALQTYLNGALS